MFIGMCHGYAKHRPYRRREVQRLRPVHPNCAEGALQIIDGKTRIVNDAYCDGLGACLGRCPQDAITIIERKAPEFDEEAVHEHLETLKTRETLACDCPAPQVQELKGSPAGRERAEAPAQSTLRH